MASPAGADLHTPGPLGVPPSSAGIGKVSKAASNYRSPAAGENPCGDCRYFKESSCTKVTGTISASMTCDLYAPATQGATESFRGAGGTLLAGRGPGGKRTHGQSYFTGEPGRGSILNPAVYDALRRKGMSKADAAAISNGQLNKKTMGGKWYSKGKHSSKHSEPEEFSTPGRARALRALGAARRANTERVAKGEKPVVGGKKVDKIPGLTKAKAKKRVKAPRQTTPKGEGPAGFSEPRLTLQQFFDKASYMKAYNQTHSNPHIQGPKNVNVTTKSGAAVHTRAAGKKYKGKTAEREVQVTRARQQLNRGVRNQEAARRMKGDQVGIEGAMSFMRGHGSDLSMRRSLAKSIETARLRRYQGSKSSGDKAKYERAKARTKKIAGMTPLTASEVFSMWEDAKGVGLESFFDKRAYMKTYNAQRHGAGRAHAAQMAGGAMGGHSKALGGTAVKGNVNRVAKNRRQAGAKRDARAAVAAAGGGRKRALRPSTGSMGADVRAIGRAPALNKGESRGYHVKGWGTSNTLANAKGGIRAKQFERALNVSYRKKEGATIRPHEQKLLDRMNKTNRAEGRLQQMRTKKGLKPGGRYLHLRPGEQLNERGGGDESRLTLQEFFDKKSYMATYNKRRYAPRRVSEVGRRQAASGLGRLNRSKKISMSNPSAASTARIARLGMKTGGIGKGSSKSGIKAYVRGFAKARKGRALNEGVAKVNRFGGKGSPPAFRHSESEEYFDKRAYMKAYNARKNGGGAKRSQTSIDMDSGRGAERPKGKLSPSNPWNRSASSIVASARAKASAGPLGSKAPSRGGTIKVKTAAAPKPRLVTRKGGLNPRARGPRALKTKVGGAKNQAYIRGHGYDPRGPGAG